MARANLEVVGENDAPSHAAAVPPADAAANLTIEQLAARAGMTVRNIRSHQARGLLPPPEVRQRIGYYGAEHLARLQLIRDLQAEGFNLKGIKRLIERSGADTVTILDLARTATAPFETEEPEVFSADELAERFDVPARAQGETLEEAVRLGVLRPLGQGRYEVSTPSLLDAAEEVMARGVSLREALGIVEHLHRHCEAVSRRFIKLFMDNVWKPFEEAGMPEDQWPEVLESIEGLRPLAAQALLAVFGQTMTSEVESSTTRMARRLAREAR